MATAYIGAINAEVSISASRSGGTVSFAIPWRIWTDSGWSVVWRQLTVDGSMVINDESSAENSGAVYRSETTPAAGTKTIAFTVAGKDGGGNQGESTGYASVSYPAQVFTVTFDPGAGSVAETSRNVSYGAALGTLPTPTPPAGYGFAGWYDGSAPVTAETVCTGDVTVLARYTPLAVLHLVLDGAPETVTDIRVVENGTPKQVLSVWSVTNGVPKQGV